MKVFNFHNNVHVGPVPRKHESQYADFHSKQSGFLSLIAVLSQYLNLKEDIMSFMKSTISIAKATVAAVALTTITATSVSAADITLRGASLFDEKHAYTKTLREFERLVGEAYKDKGEIAFEMHLNGELGDESDFVTFLQQGVAIDYAIMAPSNMAVTAIPCPVHRAQGQQVHLLQQ